MQKSRSSRALLRFAADPPSGKLAPPCIRLQRRHRRCLQWMRSAKEQTTQELFVFFSSSSSSYSLASYYLRIWRHPRDLDCTATLEWIFKIRDFYYMRSQAIFYWFLNFFYLICFLTILKYSYDLLFVELLWKSFSTKKEFENLESHKLDTNSEAWNYTATTLLNQLELKTGTCCHRTADGMNYTVRARRAVYFLSRATAVTCCCWLDACITHF